MGGLSAGRILLAVSMVRAGMFLIGDRGSQLLFTRMGIARVRCYSPGSCPCTVILPLTLSLNALPSASSAVG